MLYQSHTLPNGLRIIHRPFPSEISYCGFAVNTGTRDEMPDEHGMAHFVEHMLFKGTKKRKSFQIVNRMEHVGGEVNAYTTKEETFIYSVFLEEYFARAVELLSDVVFDSEFPENQIRRERDVILDEINSYIDTPSELIYDDFENLLFPECDFGHYILGTPQSLADFDSQKVKKFVRRQYNPSQMVFFSFGKTPFSKVVRLAEKYITRLDNIEPKKTRKIPAEKPVEIKKIRKNTTQAHVIIGQKTVDMYHPQRYTVYLLNNILGGGSMNSRLNMSLREKHGLVYTVDSSVTFYTDTGVFALYFGCDHAYVDKCISLINNGLRRLREVSLTPSLLATAKRQLKGQWGISSENHENVSLAMAKSFLHFNTYPSFDEVFRQIESVTAQQIREMADEMLDMSKMSQLRYV